MFGTTTMAAPTTTVAAPMAGYAAAPMTTMAAPITTMAAAPTTTLAAPMTGYAAAPMTAMGAPMTTVAAAPTMTAMAAPAFGTMAAPVATTQVASYVAPPVAAPMMTTMAAPAYAAAAPMVTTQAPSFVAGPTPVQTMMMPAPAVAMPQPAMPVRLTEGLPDPNQIAAQKAGYSHALDKQLKEAMETVAKETQIEKEMVKFAAEKNIALYHMQVDEQLTQTLALADEQATVAHCELRKALVDRNLQLNNQAQNLLMDYNMKSVMTEFEQKKYAFAQQYVKAETGLAQDYAKQAMKAATGTAYAAPAAVV